MLPDGAFDPAEATARIRAHLTGEQTSTALAEPEPNPAEVFIAEAQRLHSTIARTVHRPEFLSYAREHPDQARAVVAELRALLYDIEAAAGDPDVE